MNSLDYVVDKVLKVIRRDIRKNTSDSYDTGTVKRIDGNIAWVQYDENNPQLTPVIISGASCKKGDEVRIKNNNGTAFILGNDSNPPTDDAEALVAKAVAKVADKNAAKAKTTADGAQATANAVSGIANTALTQAQEAKQIADDTEQHFWFTETGTDTGAHITEVTQDEWEDVSDPNYHAGGNLLARTNGIAVRDGMTELASFGDSVLLGKIGGMQVEQTTTGMKFIGSDGYYYAKITADSSSGLDISNTASMLHVRIGNIIELVNDMGDGLQVNATSGDIDVTGKATLGAINGDSLFAYSSVSMTSSSISANASGEVTSSASNKTKYYPIAITNVNITTGAASLRRFYFSTQQTGKAVVKIGLQNDGTSAKTISVSADILWVKIAV